MNPVHCGFQVTVPARGLLDAGLASRCTTDGGQQVAFYGCRRGLDLPKVTMACTLIVMGEGYLSRRSCRWDASWCRTVRSFSGLMGALQQVSNVAFLSESASVQCANRKYGSSCSGNPCRRQHSLSMLRYPPRNYATSSVIGSSHLQHPFQPPWDITMHVQVCKYLCFNNDVPCPAGAGTSAGWKGCAAGAQSALPGIGGPHAGASQSAPS